MNPFDSKRFMKWVFHGKTSIEFNHAQVVSRRGANKPPSHKFCPKCFERIPVRKYKDHVGTCHAN